MLTYYNPCIKIIFSKRTFNARSGKRLFNKTHVLRTLLDVRKACVIESTLNVCYSIYMFTMRTFNMRLKNACLTPVAHFPV